MENEILYIALALCSFVAVAIAYSISRQALLIFFGVFNMLLFTAGSVVTEIFGLVVPIGTAMYAASFLATDIVAEMYGKREARKLVYIQLFVFIFVPIIMWLTLKLEPAGFGIATHEALQTIFAAAWRISAALVAAIALAQTFDIWFFHYIKEKTQGRWLWLRNNLSTAVSQFFDSAIFWTIAFYGIVPNIWHAILVAYVVKLIAALVDTPFIYFAKYLKGQTQHSEHFLGSLFQAAVRVRGRY